MILVAGATGVLGGEIARRLLERPRGVRATVRATSDPKKIAELERLGAEIVYADLKDRSSLERACRGVEAVVSGVTAIIPTQPGDSIAAVDHAGQVALVEAAKQAGAQQFVYISYSGRLLSPSPLTIAKRTVEAHLAESGLAFTILRPTYFMESWLGPPLGFDLATGHVRILGTGEQRVSFISVGDVAEFAVLSLENPAASGRTLELGGPAAMAPLEVVSLAEEVSGRKIEVEHVPVEALERQRAAASNPTEETFADFMLYATKDDVVEMSPLLEELPVRLTTVEEYVRRILRAAA